MAAVNFPNLKPSARSFKPGSFPIEEFQGQNGAVTAVKFGNRKADSELMLTFQNITDAQGYEIFQNHETVMGTVPVVNGKSEWNYIEFPSTDTGAMAGIGGAQSPMREATAETSGVRRYRYAEPPQFVSTFPGRCTVTIKLRGYLDG